MRRDCPASSDQTGARSLAPSSVPSCWAREIARPTISCSHPRCSRVADLVHVVNRSGNRGRRANRDHRSGVDRIDVGEVVGRCRPYGEAGLEAPGGPAAVGPTVGSNALSVSALRFRGAQPAPGSTPPPRAACPACRADHETPDWRAELLHAARAAFVQSFELAAGISAAIAVATAVVAEVAATRTRPGA
jgi:hypothetical protein